MAWVAAPAPPPSLSPPHLGHTRASQIPLPHTQTGTQRSHSLQLSWGTSCPLGWTPACKAPTSPSLRCQMQPVPSTCHDNSFQATRGHSATLLTLPPPPSLAEPTHSQGLGRGRGFFLAKRRGFLKSKMKRLPTPCQRGNTVILPSP